MTQAATCRCGPHDLCTTCDAPVIFDRKRRVTIDVHEAWRLHVCPPPAPARLLECTCGYVVAIAPDGTKKHWPSGLRHGKHPPYARSMDDAMARRWERWYEAEEKLASPPPTRIAPVASPAAPHARSLPPAGESDDPTFLDAPAAPAAPARQPLRPRPQQPARPGREGIL